MGLEKEMRKDFQWDASMAVTLDYFQVGKLGNGAVSMLGSNSAAETEKQSLAASLELQLASPKVPVLAVQWERQ
jgi:hypothetical protein